MPVRGLVSSGGAAAARASIASGLLVGLTAYWKLDEASGTRVDATGRGNNLTDNNTVGQATGRVGQAAQFASSKYLSRASTVDLEMGNFSFTIAGWFYPDTTGSQYLVSKGSTPIDYEVNLSGTDLGWVYYSDNYSYVNTVGAVVSAWQMFVVGYDAPRSKLFVQQNNGTLVEANRLSAPPVATTHTFNIGRRMASAGNYFNGRLDEIGIWKRLLTVAEKTHLYNAGAGRTYPFA